MSPTKYAAQIERTKRRITDRGAVVTFSRGGGQVYDDTTGTWSPPVPAETAAGVAIQVEDDPEMFQALGLVFTNPITLKVAASGLAYAPQAGDTFVWTALTYTVRAVEPLAPDGYPLLYRVLGSR